MKVRELYTDESKWTQGAFARTKYGSGCPRIRPEACCFCLLGAVLNCYPNKEQQIPILEKLTQKVNPEGTGTCWFKSNFVIEWNDHPTRSFTEVKELVDELDI